MTIIQPNKKRKSKIKFLAVPVLLIIFAAAYMSIMIYEDIVDLRHVLLKQEKELEKLEVANAELKNGLYSVLDANNLKKAALEVGLILDKNPSYLEVSKDAFAISL